MLSFLFVELAFLTAVAALCNFDGRWLSYRGRCYYISPRNHARTYQNALEACQNLGALLLSVGTKDPSDFVVTNLINCTAVEGCDFDTASTQYWIGLRKNASLPASPGMHITERRAGWNWLGNVRYEWDNWYGTEPTYNRGHVLMRSDGKWTSGEPQHRYRYLCDREDITKREPMTTRWYKPSTTIKTTTESESDTSGKEHGDDKNLYIGVVFGVLLPVGAVVTIVVVLYRKKRYQRTNRATENPGSTYYNTETSGDGNNITGTLDTKNHHYYNEGQFEGEIRMQRTAKSDYEDVEDLNLAYEPIGRTYENDRELGHPIGGTYQEMVPGKKCQVLPPGGTYYNKT